MPISFVWPDPCPDCNRIHVFCCWCGSRHTVDQIQLFFCVRCGARFSDSKTPATPPADLSDRQRLEAALAAPAAQRPPAHQPQPEALVAPPPVRPDLADLQRFLWDQYPQGAQRVPTSAIRTAWSKWCRQRDLPVRTQTWLGGGLGRCRGTTRASGRTWMIAPAPPLSRRPWHEAIARIRLQHVVAADILEQQAEMGPIIGRTTTIEVPRQHLPLMQRLSRVITPAFDSTLRVNEIHWAAINERK